MVAKGLKFKLTFSNTSLTERNLLVFLCFLKIKELFLKSLVTRKILYFIFLYLLSR